MADLGVHLTDKRMKSLTKRLNEVYNQAYVESVENNKSAIEKLSQVKADINAGKYDNLNDDQKTAKINAYTLQVMRTENIVDDMSKRINNAGVTAQNIIHGEMNGIYALNRDYSNYSILKQSEVDYSFSQYDMNQIAVLVQEGESPFTKIAYKKMGQDPDITRRLQNELIKATINGESQSQIMKRIKGITGQKGYKARRVAQTERTRVQTQARMMSIREAEAIGIAVDKQWVARMVRTRESHQDVHLQIVRSDEVFNNGLEFPGDPKGSAAEVINCHCYVKPMVKSVSPSLAKHRFEYGALDFEEYQKRLKNSQIDDIININKGIYPDEIAGVKRGNPMTVDEANHNKPNPNFSKSHEYRINCQSCVVSYEARLRGYDVQTLPNTKGSALSDLSRKTNTAWIDPKTGTYPEYIKSGEILNAKSYMQFLEKNIESNNRYTIEWSWKGSKGSGHIISLSRNDIGELDFYDPQTGKHYNLNEFNKWAIKNTKFKTTVYGTTFNISPEILRVDDKYFNLDVVNNIMEGTK